jgi:hypothetical protein
MARAVTAAREHCVALYFSSLARADNPAKCRETGARKQNGGHMARRFTLPHHLSDLDLSDLAHNPLKGQAEPLVLRFRLGDQAVFVFGNHPCELGHRIGLHDFENPTTAVFDGP